MSLWEKKKKKVSKKLKKYWGYSTLKPKQIEIISNFVDGKDVIGLLPTGYGKSMCYLVPPLITKKAIFIISPLISLMEDQKEKLLQRGIPVSALHGNNPRKDREVFDIIDGIIKIIYMSPEYLINGEGLELAKTLVEDKKLGYFAVDESHCISVWGHDFRRNYLKLYRFRKKFPEIPILAVTATATKVVVDEIDKYLKLKDRLLVTANFDRPNLYIKFVNVQHENLKKVGKRFCVNGCLHVFDDSSICKKCKIDPDKHEYTEDEYAMLMKNKRRSSITKLTEMQLMDKWLRKYEGSKIIIYSNSRKSCVEIAELINEKNKKTALAYHAGMSKKLRNMIQHDFSSGKVNIIVSTIAFGMGIDQIVRCVLIFGASSSIEEYYQQIGRAGRDGDPAETVLFYEKQKLVVNMKMIEKETRNPEVKRIKKINLSNMMNLSEHTGCRRRFILEYFQERAPKFFCCNNCDNCTEKNLTDYTKKFLKIMYKKKKIKKVFDEDEILLMKKHKLINGTSVHSLTDFMKYWKGFIEFKKYKHNEIPDKLKIKLLN
jgi:superfamily II DNA helicase RecQ